MFTDRYVRNLKPEDKIKDIREKNGFGVRVKPDGSKTFFYRYESPITGKRRTLTLGGYPETTLEAARIAYGAAFKTVKAGGDPLAAAQQEQEELRKAPTVQALCEEYIERHAKKFKRSWETDERILNHDVIPAWGNRKAADIVKRDVVLLLEKIVDRGSPTMANNTFAVIRKMFNFAIERDILQHTPCYMVKPPAPKVSRERVFSESEIRTFWNNLENCAMSAETKRVLKLILITAQRPGEVAGMHTNEIEGEWWTIPAERAKNKKTHRVYLSALARTILSEAIEQASEARDVPPGKEYEGFVFPTPSKKKEQAMAPQALIVAVNRSLKSPVVDAKDNAADQGGGKLATANKIGLDHFTPHDLRRTAATFMAKSGEMDEVIDAVLNHTKQGVIRVYNQFKYDAQKQAALESWSRRLIGITTGVKGKVIPIGSRSKPS